MSGTEEHISQIVDRGKVSSDKDFLVSQLMEIFDTMQKLTSFKVDLKGATSVRAIGEAAQGGAKTVDVLAKSVDKLNFAISNENIELQKNNALIQAANKEAKSLGKEQAGLTTEYDKQSKRLEVVKNQLKGLVATGQDTGEVYEKLRKEFTELDTTVRKADKSVGDFRRNVGNYEGSAKIIVDALDKEKKKLEELEKARIRVQNAGSSFNPGSGVAARTTITGFAGGGDSNVPALNNIASTAKTADDAIKQLNEEIEKSRTVVEGFNRITESDKFLNIAAKVGDSNAELKFFTKTLIELERTGQGNGDFATQLRKHLAELTDQIGDTRAEIKALSSDTRGFDLFAGSVSLIADSFQTAAGAAVLFGANEKDAAEATKTLVAIQSVANGVKSIANELTTKGTAANKLLTLGQKAYTFAVGESTGAMRIFRQAMLALGITAIIFGLYEAAKAMGVFGDAAEEAAEKQQALNDETEKYLDNVKKADELSKATRDRAKGGVFEQERELKLLKDRKAPLDEIYKAEVKLSQLKTDEANKSFFSAKQDIEDAKLRGASQEIINDLTLKAIAAEKAYKDAQADTASVGLKYEQDLSSKKKDLRDKALKELNDNLKEQLDLQKRNSDAEKSIAIETTNEKIRQAEKILDSEDSSIQSQLNAINVIANRKKTIAFIEYQDAIKAEQQVKDGKLIEIKKTQTEIEAATLSFNNKLNVINDEALKSQQDAQKQNTEKEREERLKALDTSAQAERDRLKKENNDAKIALDERFQQGKISQEQYADDRKRIELAYQQESLQNEIAYQQQLIDISDLPAEKKAEALRRLSDLEAELSELSVQLIKDAEAEKLAAIEKTFDAIKSKSDAAFSFIGDALNVNSQNQKNKLQEEQDAAEQKAARDIEIAQASTATEEEKARRIADINARLDAQKRQFAERERQINLQNARFEKTKTIFQIALQTARSIVEASPNPFKIALAAAVGAVQLGLAIATPLPKYYKGKNVTDLDKYEGLATVNEYRDEVIKRADGSVEFPKGRNVTTWLGSDDQVYPSLDAYLNSLLAATHMDTMPFINGAPVIINQKTDDNVLMEVKKQTNYLQRIANKPAANISIYDNGHAQYEIESTNW